MEIDYSCNVGIFDLYVQCKNNASAFYQKINLCQYIVVKDTKVRPNVLMMWKSNRKEKLENLEKRALY